MYMIWMKMNMANNPSVTQIKDIKKKYGIFLGGVNFGRSTFFFMDILRYRNLSVLF